MINAVFPDNSLSPKGASSQDKSNFSYPDLKEFRQSGFGSKKILIIIIGIFLTAGSVFTVAAAYRNNQASKSEKNEMGVNSESAPPTSETNEGQSSPSPIVENPSASPVLNQPNVQPTSKPTVKPATSPSATANPTSTPAPTSAPTAIPQRNPDPPRLSISYPSEGQSISMSTSQTFCVVDVPEGGSREGLERRHRINSGSWSSYAGMSTLCYSPAEGANTLELQYRNKYSDTSDVITRRFNFHRQAKITISLSGEVYSDANCNGSKDAGESTITGEHQGYIWNEQYFNFKEFRSSANGTYTHTEEIDEGVSIQRRISFVAPSGFKSNPNYDSPFLNFSAAEQSKSISIPMVPGESIGQCTF